MMIKPNKKIADNMTNVHTIYLMTITPNLSMFIHVVKLGDSIKVNDRQTNTIHGVLCC